MSCYRIVCCVFALVSSGVAEILELDPAAKEVKQFSTNASMIGVRNTLLMYLFPEKKAALKVLIDNKTTEFPITATVYRFAPDTKEEALEKWQNNQHSDALYMDAAKPVETFAVPAKSCEVMAKTLLETKQHRNGEYANYEVAFRISGFKKDGQLDFKELKGKAKVAVLVKAS